MSRTHKPRHWVYVVLRLDAFHDEHTPIQDKLMVKEVVTTAELAEAEVQRLNALNGDKQVFYWWQAARLFPDGTDAGPPEHDAAIIAVVKTIEPMVC